MCPDKVIDYTNWRTRNVARCALGIQNRKKDFSAQLGLKGHLEF